MTEAGQLIDRLVDIVSSPSEEAGSLDDSALVTVVEPQVSFISDILPLGGELVAALTRTSRQGGTGQSCGSCGPVGSEGSVRRGHQ